MRLFCNFTGHEASAETIRNGGSTFSRCVRCGSDLVETAGAWKTAPKGFRIVWKSAAEETSGPSLLSDPEQARAEPDPSEIAPQMTVRSPIDRRQSTDRKLPAFLNGNDRRRADRRRKEFGRKVAGPRA